MWGRRPAVDDQPVVVVTGASAGIGRAVAHRFAAAGASLGLIARDADALEHVKREVETLGGRAICLPLDVSDAAAIFEAAETVERVLGPISVWINGAMLTVVAPISDVTPDEFKRVTEVTYLGFVYGTMAALQHMKPRKRGVIVQMGSGLAYRGIPLQSAYTGAKHAIRGFTDSVRAELLWERCPVKLSTVELPAVNTPQFDWARTHMPGGPRPVGTVYQPEVAAEAIYKAAHNPKREYWLGWTTVASLLGNILSPNLMDLYLARTAYGRQDTPEEAEPGRLDNLRAPVAMLHRTRGSYGQGAKADGVLTSGSTARLGLVLAGAAACLAAGFAMGRKGRANVEVI